MSSKIIRPSGKEIRKLLIDREITMKTLAGEFGVSANYIHQICRDERKAVRLRQQIYQFLKGEAA